MRQTPRKRTKPFLKETIELLLPLQPFEIEEDENQLFLNKVEDLSNEESWQTFLN